MENKINSELFACTYIITNSCLIQHRKQDK